MYKSRKGSFGTYDTFTRLKSNKRFHWPNWGSRVQLGTRWELTTDPTPDPLVVPLVSVLTCQVDQAKLCFAPTAV